jgi:hypothetical protein
VFTLLVLKPLNLSSLYWYIDTCFTSMSIFCFRFLWCLQLALLCVICIVTGRLRGFLLRGSSSLNSPCLLSSCFRFAFVMGCSCGISFSLSCSFVFHRLELSVLLCLSSNTTWFRCLCGSRLERLSSNLWLAELSVVLFSDLLQLFVYLLQNVCIIVRAWAFA